MPAARHVLINGLSMGTGGGLTVGRELLHHLARVRPDCRFTMAVVTGLPLHEELRPQPLPANAALLWAPPETAGRAARSRYENDGLVRWASENRTDAVLQLNGMVVSKLRLPVLAHMQDPFPYRREAWTGWRDRVVSFLKRRAHRTALTRADCVGWTSAYLRDLICGELGLRPRCSEVFYNGVPDEWIDRATHRLPPGPEGRPMEIVTVSNVSPYKRQDLVIRAVALLARRPEFADLKYRIVGHCPDSERQRLSALARELNVENRVVIRGRVEDAELPALYSNARCYTLMSVCESFGIPAIEAMSFGTPVVVSDCCAMPEVCGSGADLSPVDDAAALADRLARVLLDASHAEELRRAGVERVRQFGWSNTASKMADAVDRLAGHTPG